MISNANPFTLHSGLLWAVTTLQKVFFKRWRESWSLVTAVVRLSLFSQLVLCNILTARGGVVQEGWRVVVCTVQYSAVQSTRVFTSGSVSSLWAGSQRSRVDIRQCYSVTVLHSEIYPKTTISTNKRIFSGKGKYLVCSGCLVVLSRLTRLTRLFKLFHHFISINTLCK